MKKRPYKTIELFAGCGGLLEGFKQTGLFSTTGCVEWEVKQSEVLKERLKTAYGYNNVNDIVLRFDIQRTEELINGWSDKEYGFSKGLKDLVGVEKIDIISGGPPCQAYSVAGRVQDSDGMKNDYRNYLFESYLKVVDEFKPSIFIFENVEGLLSAKPDGFNIIEQIRSEFLSSGYHIVEDIRSKALIDFTDYGVPQKRKRVILMGVNEKKFPNYNVILSDFYDHILPSYKESKIRSVKDAICDLPKLLPMLDTQNNGKLNLSHMISEEQVDGHVPRFHSKRDIEIFKELATDILLDQNKYHSIEAKQALYTERTGRVSNIHKYHVLKWDQPSNTIPAHLKKDGLRHIHPDPEQARSITVREAARLQTFPDDFKFSGVMTKDYEMIGNAVPPLFAKKLAYAIDELLKKYDKEIF
jgi:DNA (cytosine-5)-methyltransferase 1